MRMLDAAKTYLPLRDLSIVAVNGGAFTAILVAYYVAVAPLLVAATGDPAATRNVVNAGAGFLGFWAAVFTMPAVIGAFYRMLFAPLRPAKDDAVPAETAKAEAGEGYKIAAE